MVDIDPIVMAKPFTLAPKSGKAPDHSCGNPIYRQSNMELNNIRVPTTILPCECKPLRGDEDTNRMKIQLGCVYIRYVHPYFSRRIENINIWTFHFIYCKLIYLQNKVYTHNHMISTLNHVFAFSSAMTTCVNDLSPTGWCWLCLTASACFLVNSDQRSTKITAPTNDHNNHQIS